MDSDSDLDYELAFDEFVNDFSSEQRDRGLLAEQVAGLNSQNFSLKRLSQSSPTFGERLLQPKHSSNGSAQAYSTASTSKRQLGDRKYLVGKLKIHVSEVKNLTSNTKRSNYRNYKPRFIVNFNGEERSSPAAERIEVGDSKSEKYSAPFRFTWTKEDGSFEFDVNDMPCDLSIQVFAKDRSDSLIGQVVVPIPTSFEMPFFTSKCLTSLNSGILKLKGWFELYPLPKHKLKFAPAAPTVSKTGMKLTQTLGFINLECHLELFLPQWYIYLALPVPSTEEHLNTNANQPQTKMIAYIHLLMQASRQLRRNILRYNIAKSYLYQTYFVQIMHRVEYYRSWKSPFESFCFMLLTFLFVSYLETWQYPFLFFFLTIICSIFIFSKKNLLLNWEAVEQVYSIDHVDQQTLNRHDDFITWNSDIHDPRDSLNLLQKAALAINQLNSVQLYIGKIASYMEKAANSLNFADYNATSALYAYVFMWTLVCSLTLRVIQIIFHRFQFHVIVLSSFVVFMIPPSKSTCAQASESFIMSKWKYIQQITCNVFERIPDSNEKGHRYISAKQRQFAQNPHSIDRNITAQEESNTGENLYGQLHEGKASVARPLPHFSERFQKTLEEVICDRIRILGGYESPPNVFLKSQRNCLSNEAEFFIHDRFIKIRNTEEELNEGFYLSHRNPYQSDPKSMCSTIVQTGDTRIRSLHTNTAKECLNNAKSFSDEDFVKENASSNMNNKKAVDIASSYKGMEKARRWLTRKMVF